MLTGAVIVTYNPTIDVLVRLIRNINASVELIVIVDNGSQNLDEISSLATAFGKIEFLPLKKNTGVGYAQNRGIEKVFNNTKIAAVVLFDHDSNPTVDMIDNLIKNYSELEAKHGRVGAVGPLFIDPRTNNRYPIPVSAGLSLKRLIPKEDDTLPVVTSFLIASGSLIPRATIEAVGGMNEDFFIDYVDNEWSFRAYAKGFQLYTCPEAKMYHQIGDERMKVFGREISVHSPLRRYYLARNSILMSKMSYISWKYKVRELVYTFSRIVVYLLFVDNKMTYIRYITKGWRDGIRGKTGPFPGFR